ncbi:MAG TPA: peptide-methionine (R)-S-oxide reductase MsrB [Gallionellaceae bacterium]|nr:peptide-methionine (R)-S-oxide reductase MsrB [Gallionellaceae bacterium]
MDRRSFVKLVAGGAGMALLGGYGLLRPSASLAGRIERIDKSDEEWKRLLTLPQYEVLRKEGTERPFTSPLNKEKRNGTFICAGCGLDLFPSRFKYDSGTGWPSFFDVLPGHVETKQDFQLLLPRTEYHCARCGGHHGHVFNDGPKPTGLRYCNNGVALVFKPEQNT